MAKTIYDRSLALWRSYAALSKPDSKAAARLIAGLSNEALAVAAVNPDVDPLSRTRIDQELRARNAPAQPPSLTAPGFLIKDDVERAVPKGLWGPERYLRVLGAMGFWLAVVATLGASSVLQGLREEALTAAHQAGVLSASDYSQRDIEAPGGGHTLGEAFMNRPDLAPYATASIREEAIAEASAFVCIAAGLVWVVGGIFRARPARILLLRKFNNVEVDRRLRRFVRRNLSPLGHVFVLADKHYKRPRFNLGELLFYWSPTFWGPKLVLIPWDLLRGRLGPSSAGGALRVFGSGSFRRFGERVADRFACNAQVMSNSRRSVIVRTGDAWWRQTVSLLMCSADMIVVDLSDVAAGTEWELDRLQELDVLDRAVFIVRQDATDAMAKAQERLSLWVRHGALNPLVWRGLKSGAKEAQRAFERLGLTEGEFAPIVFGDNGRPRSSEHLHRCMREALAAGVKAKIGEANRPSGQESSGVVRTG